MLADPSYNSMDYSNYSSYRNQYEDSNQNYNDDRSYPRVTSRQGNERRQQHEVKNARQTNQDRPTRDRIAKNLPPKYFQIQPYLDNILKDQISDNKQVQRNLKDLRSINDRMISDLGGNKYSRQGEPVKGSYWDEIQKVIMQIINNSEDEAEDFKANLQHLKNINTRTMNQDLGYYEGDDRSHSQHQLRNREERGRNRVQSKTSYHEQPRYPNPSRPFSEAFQPRTENQRRLVDEIHALKEQNQYLRKRLREQVEKNRSLTYELQDLEEENYSFRQHGRGNDRSQIGSRRDFEDNRNYLNKLNQQLKDTNHDNDVLKKELKTIRHEKRGFKGSIDEMKQHIGELGSYVAASQKRAAEYETLKNNQQQVLHELNRLKKDVHSQNGLAKTKSQTRYKNYPDEERNRNLETSLAQNRYQQQGSVYRRDERQGRDNNRYY